MKREIMNASIQEVANLFKNLRKDGFTIEQIEEMIFEQNH